MEGTSIFVEVAVKVLLTKPEKQAR